MPRTGSARQLSSISLVLRTAIAGLVLGALVSGCSPPATEAPPSGESSTAAQDVRLYVFDCGRIQLTDLGGFDIENDETEVRELAVPCYVVEHPGGRLLWDGGLPSATAETPGWQKLGPTMAMRLDVTLAEQLDALELDLEAFDYVAYSHFHFDHVGVANEVAGATALIQAAEHEAAFSGESLPGFDPALYADLREAEKLLLDGDHDVFGDGRVRILSSPGHTPGHQVLFVDLENTGKVVLSGDLYHFRLSREERRVPSFNTDREETLRSMDRVEAFLTANDAELWIEHELALFEQQRLAPAYYD